MTDREYEPPTKEGAAQDLGWNRGKTHESTSGCKHSAADRKIALRFTGGRD